MRISIIQIKPENNSNKLKKKIIEIILSMIKKKINIIVFPELTLAQYGKCLFKYNNNKDFIKKIKKFCLKYKIYICIGEYTKKNQKYYNTIQILTPNEKDINYNKNHIYPLEHISLYPITSGKNLVTFKINNIKFGVMTCYDLRFDTEAVLYKKENCDIIIGPSAWVLKKNKPKDYIRIIKNIAQKSKSYVLFTNMTGNIGGIEWSGNSSIVNSNGNLIKNLNKEEGYIIFNVTKKYSHNKKR